jgi:hypothetical protein
MTKLDNRSSKIGPSFELRFSNFGFSAVSVRSVVSLFLAPKEAIK